LVPTTAPISCHRDLRELDLAIGHAGVVDPDVHRAKVFDRALPKRLRCRQVGNLAGAPGCLSAALSRQGGDGLVDTGLAAA
jgi:hypothetical protein